MSEDLMRSVGVGESSFDSSAKVAGAEEATPPTQAARGRPSVLAQQLATPAVRLMDRTAILAALVLHLFNSPLREGQSLSNYMAARISLRNLLVAAALLTLWRMLCWATGIYQASINYRAAVLFWKIPFLTLLCAIAAFPLLRCASPAAGSIVSATLFWFFSCTLLLIVRAGVVTYEEQVRPAFRTPRTAVICGTGPLAHKKAAELAIHPRYRYQLLGFVDSEPHPGMALLGLVLCGVGGLEQLLMHQPIDEVVIGLPLKSHFGEVEEIVRICGRAGVQMQYSLDLFNTEIAKNRKVDGERSQQVVLEMVHHDHRVLLKNIMDRTLSAVGLLVLAPVFACIALAIRVSGPGPVFFVQRRVGLNKRPFRMIKFRSMTADAEARQPGLEHMNENSGPTFKIRRDPRVTRLGAFLRRTSLDELPQLVNVLKGDMSLVGPRPLPMRDVERFSEPWLMRRFSVKPGITGLWQVSGRSNTDFNNAIKLDLRYIDRWSLLMDIGILFRTVEAVIRRHGAY